MTTGPTGSTEAGDLVCSAKGCRAPAVWAVRWNNPRLHTPERRKIWLACGDHRDHLEGFLGARGFFQDTVGVHELATTDG